MQLVVALNRLSAVAAKQRHGLIFSKRNSFFMIAFCASLAAISSIPGFTHGFEIDPYRMTVRFITEPSYVWAWAVFSNGLVCMIAIQVMIAYTTAFIILK